MDEASAKGAWKNRVVAPNGPNRNAGKDFSVERRKSFSFAASSLLCNWSAAAENNNFLWFQLEMGNDFLSSRGKIIEKNFASAKVC